MTVELSVITELSELQAMGEAWNQLAATEGTSQLFRGPDWLISWWHAYHRILHAQLHVVAGHADGELICLAPFYARVGRGAPGVKIREIRLLGDAGPRPPALDILVAPGYEDQAGKALAKYMATHATDWDVIELEPLQDPSRGRAAMITWLGNSGLPVRTSTAASTTRRIALAVAGIDMAEETTPESLITVYSDDPTVLRKGLSALQRLSRLEWAQRDEHSPLADREASGLLEEVTLNLGRDHRARLVRLDDSSGEAIAIALVVDDRDRAVVLAMGADPQHVERQAPARLLMAEARAAAGRGQVALDVVTGAYEYDLPPLPTSRQRALSVRVYSSSSAAAVTRTYGAVRKRVEAAREAPGSAAAGARAAWAKIRTAAANVASYDRLHLYRGELWTRGIQPTAGLTLSLFSEADFDALEDHARAEMIEALDLDEPYCRHKWQRGDTVVFAQVFDRPAGIAWSAGKSVSVPELDRTLRLSGHEAYIHDVYVAPQARGRSVAPSMLEFLAHELRQGDVYRAWALISSDNVASVRAFEKAAYVAVADIIHAHIASVDRIIVRPPDAEAKRLFGLS